MAEAQRPAVNSAASRPRDGSVVTTIKRYHDDAFSKISKALDFDEQGNVEKAAHYYGAGIQSLSMGLEVRYDDESAGSEDARGMRKKMRKSIVQIKQRLEELENDKSSRRQPTAPPLEPGTAPGAASGSRQAISASEIETMEAMASLGDSIMASEEESPPSYAESEANADQVLNVEGVQIYFINSAGHVSAPSSPSSLRIYKFRGDRRQDADCPPAFLQVSDWLYPLMPGQSPALKSSDGSYIFPDLNAAESHCFVGLILSPDVASAKKIALEGILDDLTALQVQSDPATRDVHSAAATSTRPKPPRPPPPQTKPKNVEEGTSGNKETEKEEEELPTWSRTISKGIVKGTEWVSWGVSKGVEYSGKLIHKGSTKLRDNIKPDENPTQVDPKYQKSLYYAKEATSVAVKVSNVLVSSLHYLAKRAAGELAPVIKRHGERLLPDSIKPDQVDAERQKTIDGVSHVALSGLKGFGQVYLELESAAKTLARSISNATVETVKYKYGEEAASATSNGLHTVGNIGLTAYNIDNIGIKALAKHTAKNTGVALIEDSQKDQLNPPKSKN